MANSEFLKFNIFINGNAPKDVSLKNDDVFNLTVKMTFHGGPQYNSSYYGYMLVVRLADDNLIRQSGKEISTESGGGGGVQSLIGNGDWWTGKHVHSVFPDKTPVEAASIPGLLAAEWQLKFDDSGADEVVSVTLPLRLSVPPASEHLDTASVEIMCVIVDKNGECQKAITAAFNSIAFMPLSKIKPKIESAVVRVDNKGDVRLEGEVSNGGKEYTIEFANQEQKFTSSHFSFALKSGQYKKEMRVTVKNTIDEDSRIPTYDSNSLLTLSVGDKYPPMVLRKGELQLHLSVATKEGFEFPPFRLEWTDFKPQVLLEDVAYKSIPGKTATIDIPAHLTDKAQLWEKLPVGHFFVSDDGTWVAPAPKPVALNSVMVVPEPIRLYGGGTIYGDNKDIRLKVFVDIPEEVDDQEKIGVECVITREDLSKDDFVGAFSLTVLAKAIREHEEDFYVELDPSDAADSLSDKSHAYEIRLRAKYNYLGEAVDAYFSEFAPMEPGSQYYVYFKFIYDPEVPQISPPQIDLDLSNDNLVVYKPGSIKYKEAHAGRPVPKGTLSLNPSNKDKVTFTITQDPQDPTKYSIGFDPFPVANLSQGFSPTNIIMTLDERDPFPVPFSMDFPKWAVSLKLLQKGNENYSFFLAGTHDDSLRVINTDLNPRVVLKTNIRLSHFWLYLKKPQSVGWIDVGNYFSFAAENVTVVNSGEVIATPISGGWNSASGQFLKVEAKDSSKGIPPGTIIEFELSGRLTIPPKLVKETVGQGGKCSTEFAVAPWPNDPGFRKDSLATVGDVTLQWGKS